MAAETATWRHLQEALDEALDRLAEAPGEPGKGAVRFWWRDDDATVDCAALRRLVDLSKRSTVPLALAAIPKRADLTLGDVIACTPGISVLQHGFAHINHNPKGTGYACELGNVRRLEDTLADLLGGRAILEDVAGSYFLPVVAPPWNQMSDQVAHALPDAGYCGVSGFAGTSLSGTYPGLISNHCHIDPIRWKGGAHFRGTERTLKQLLTQLGQLDDRKVLVGLGEPDVEIEPEAIGLLTHHLDMDTETWEFTERLLTTMATHPAVQIVSAREVFRL